MPGPKKRPIKDQYKPTSGKHAVSADGKNLHIGGSVFKRTVLPSVAIPSKETMEITDTIESDEI